MLGSARRRRGVWPRVDLRFSAEDEAFRAEARAWLTEQLDGEFAVVRGRGGPGDEHSLFEERLRVGAGARGRRAGRASRGPRSTAGAACRSPSRSSSTRSTPRADGPGRVGIIGEGLLGPTIIAFGTDDAEAPLPAADPRRATRSGARATPSRTRAPTSPTSQTRAELDGDEWVIDGQKVWTSLAHWADWCFVLCRTDRDARRSTTGISYLLVPMRQPGIEIRPIVQITGTSEFNEVFFDGARTARRQRRRRGERRLEGRHGHARVRAGRVDARPAARRSRTSCNASSPRAARTGGSTIRCCASASPTRGSGSRSCAYNALRSLSALEQADLTPLTAVHKLYWATLPPRPRRARPSTCSAPTATIAGERALRADAAQRLFLFTRADTIYGGSNQIQRNVIGERALGLPPEPKVSSVSGTDTPDYPPAHGLLAGKIVVVTAAAGTGIGFATAKRAPRRARPSSSATTTSAGSARPPSSSRRSRPAARAARGGVRRHAARSRSRASSTPRSPSTAAST